MDTSNTTLWGINAGATGDANTLFLVHGYIGIGWPEMGNLGLLPNDREAFKAKLKVTYPGLPDMSYITNTTQLHHFVHEAAIDHFVAYRPKVEGEREALVFLGRIAGPYLYNPFPEPAYPQVRRVEWLRVVPASRLSDGARHELGAQLSFFLIDDHPDEFFAALAGNK